MATFIKKPIEFEALQYEGTKESALRIIKELQIPHPRYGYDDKGKFDYFVIQQFRGTTGGIEVQAGTWVVRHPNGTIELFTDEQFKAAFQDYPTTK
jgi:hypothetical protein